MTNAPITTPDTAKKFSGNVMRGDIPVAEIEEDVIVSVSKQAPLQLQHRRNFNEWLDDRGADLNRSYMRTILRQLGLPLQNINNAVRYVNGAAVTDSFWIKERGSMLRYSDAAFAHNAYFTAALKGDPDIFTLTKEPTPEITNIGSFNKGWKYVNGTWFLFKAGSPLEIFSEIFTSRLAIALGLDAVEYRYQDGFIICKNFVEHGWDYEPAKALVGDNIGYEFNAQLMVALGLLKPYMDLIFMDAIVRNGDRHEFNYGFFTMIDGAIRLAPNKRCGMRKIINQFISSRILSIRTFCFSCDNAGLSCCR